jgi:hypothetical protein
VSRQRQTWIFKKIVRQIESKGEYEVFENCQVGGEGKGFEK